MYIRTKPHAFITVAQRDEALAALMFAEHIGLPINAAVTIHWALAGGSGTWRERQNRILDLLRRWLAHHGGTRIPYIWAAEQTPNGKDVHTHIAIHLPGSLTLAQLDQYLRSLLQADDPHVLEVDDPAKHRFGPAGWITYICKALPRGQLHLVPRPFRQRSGTVIGPRFGVAHCIGRKARKDYFRCARPFDFQSDRIE